MLFLTCLSINLFLAAGVCVVVAAAYALHRVAAARRSGRPLGRRARQVAHAALLLGAAMAGCLYYAIRIEPDWLQTTHELISTDALPAGSRLRIVHLSDLHVAEETAALTQLPNRVNALAPDVIVFTGDTLQGRRAWPLFRRLMSSLTAPEGTYATKGNHDVGPGKIPNLFEGVATELVGQPVPLRHGRLTLCGAPYDQPGLIASCLDRSPASGRVVAYHTPDLVETLAARRPILYLAGHTHGGQVRLPFYGALVTFSRFGKKYEMGRYLVDRTTLYVNRGIGGVRLRFLCRPEIAVIDLVGTG